jgi:lipopolysaccharide export system protein LptA
MNRVCLFLLAATLATAQTAPPKSQDDLLKTIDTFSGTRKPLGYEGTPLDPKKNVAPAAKKPKGQTDITASEATFDQKTREAVFLGNVVVKDPEFTVECDRLTAYLKKQKTAGEPPAANPPPANPPPGKTPAAQPKGGGLERAIAEANPNKMVKITQEKTEADGSITINIGYARHVTYDSATGDIVLTGMPSVQQGINLCVAREEACVMTLNRNGKMSVKGDHTTTIKDTNSVDGLR